jgi:hypothetical protein
MNRIAGDLRMVIEAALPRLRAVTETAAGADRGERKWRKKEILGHLIDSAANNHQRFVRTQFDDPLVIAGYDQDRWVSIHNYRGRSWDALVSLWAAMNDHVAAVIDGVAHDALQHRCTVGETTGILEWWMEDYVRHLRHHLAQILDS